METALEMRTFEAVFHGDARHRSARSARYTHRYGYARRLGASPSHDSRWMEVKTMTVLEFVALAALLLEFVSRVIELALVIRSALLTRRGKERQQ